MLNETQIVSFLLTTILLTATPGPDNLMVLSIGISGGRRSGMAFGLGCAVGCLSHTVLAVVIVPLVLAAVVQAIRGKFESHKSITRWAWPMWMYQFGFCLS